MREAIVVGLTSFLAGSLLVLLVTSPAARGRLRSNANIAQSALAIASAEKCPHLPERARRELLMGYDLLSNIFAGQSNLWLVPIVRRIAGEPPLLDETTDIIDRLARSGSKRNAELSRTLRRLPPDVSGRFKGPDDPNRLVGAIGKSVAWRVFNDLSAKGDVFNLNFVIVQLTLSRIVASVATGLLEFEENAVRRRWLEDVAKEYTSLRREVRDAIMEYVRGEKRVYLVLKGKRREECVLGKGKDYATNTFGMIRKGK